MEKGKFINKDHKSNDPTMDKWVIEKRDAILEWYESESMKADYNTASDEDMLTTLSAHIKKMCKADPSHWWYNVICEVAECVPDAQWQMSIPDIEAWLLGHIKWKPEDRKNANSNK